MTAKAVGSGALFGAAGTLTTEYPRRKRRTIAVILLHSVRLNLVAEVFGGDISDPRCRGLLFRVFSRRSPASEILESRQTLALNFFWRLGGRIEQSNSRRHFASRGIVRFLGQLLLKVRVLELLPNVKDEPRPSPARLVQHYAFDSAVSFQKSYDSTRRDGEGRWLWRLVGPFGLASEFEIE